MKNKLGMSLIEVLVAVFVFGIGILSIFSFISYNITLVNKVKNRTVSTFLAKEGLEIVYNLRDTNIYKGVVWNCYNQNKNYECLMDGKFQPNEFYKVSNNALGYYKVEQTTNQYSDNIIYYHSGVFQDSIGKPILTGFWYSHQSQNGIITNFSRYITFKELYSEGDGGFADKNKILKIESHVSSNRGKNSSGKIVLESFIGEIN